MHHGLCGATNSCLPLLLSSIFQLLTYEYRFGNLKVLASREQLPIAMG